MPYLKFKASAIPEIGGGSQNSKSRSSDSCTTMHIWRNFACFVSALLCSISLWNLTWISLSATDIWLFYDLAAKCLFPPILGRFFWGIWPLTVVGYCGDLQKAHPRPETRVLAYRSCRSVKKCDLGSRWIYESKKRKKKEKKLNVTSHIFAQTTHVALPPPKLSCGVGSRA